MTLSTIKWPPRLHEGAVIQANARHDRVYPRVSPKRRFGRVVAPTANERQVRVLWDGASSHQCVDIRFFDVVPR